MLRKALTEARLEELAKGTHSLRIGGEKAYINSPAGGELVAGFMGLWLSGSKYDYMHAARDRRETAGNAKARENGTSLVFRQEPMSCFPNRC